MAAGGRAGGPAAGRRPPGLSTRHGLELRAATVSDAPGMAALLAAAGYPVPPASLAHNLDAIRQGPGTALLALEWGPPSGLVVVHWHRTLTATLPVAQVSLLLVGAAERHRGIGRLLVKAASQAARVAGCGTLVLAAPDGRDDLHAFCLATGFDVQGACFVRPLRKKP